MTAMLDLLLAERSAFLDTVRGLSDEQFGSGPTLCSEWAPRDVLGHMIGVDFDLGQLVRSGPVTSRFNRRVVERSRAFDREELMLRGKRWATEPPLGVRLSAWFLIGDVSVHHQDVIRGLAISRDVPPRVAGAILREGLVLGPHRWTRHRLLPTDGHRPVGIRGRRQVRGTAEALGMWLAGRAGVADELDFAS
jgi:uncharacterized protein (TIGR03083 family)